MILLNNKSFEELCEQTDAALDKVGFDTSPGSIAKLFADIINGILEEFYETLTINHMQAFLTTATSDRLDKIGILLNCTRLENEDDDTYRTRISYQTLSLAKANETAIRLACLTVENVEDVKLKKFSHGPGSFSIVPITSDPFIDMTAEIEKAVVDIASYGERLIIKTPDYKKVKMTILITFSSYVNSNDKNESQEILVSVRDAIIKYINSIPLGEAIIINKLTETIMAISEEIVSYSCSLFKINNKNCLFINQGAKWDEKFIVSPEDEAIQVL